MNAKKISSCTVFEYFLRSMYLQKIIPPAQIFSAEPVGRCSRAGQEAAIQGQPLCKSVISQ